jgi:hypothetical protein
MRTRGGVVFFAAAGHSFYRGDVSGFDGGGEGGEERDDYAEGNSHERAIECEVNGRGLAADV